MATFTKRVNHSYDDGTKVLTWAAPPTGSNLFVGSYWYGDCLTAVRFTNVTIQQGATITSAKLTFVAYATDTSDVKAKVYGIDEDNTATFHPNAPGGRARTSASRDWDLNGITLNSSYDATNLTAIVQEIVDRGGWSTGNAMGFLIDDDGSASPSTYHEFYEYDGDSAKAAFLTIEYVSSSPSSSISPSSSESISISASPSLSISPSPSPGAFYGMKIAKTGYDVLKTQDPSELKFDSTKGTLKYFDKQTLAVQFDANNDVTGKNTYTHDLGYYPFVEVFTRVYIGSPSGAWEYCPFAGAGATILYKANYKLTTTDITVYGEIDGISTSVWNFEFLIFMYKNDLKLS